MGPDTDPTYWKKKMLEVVPIMKVEKRNEISPNPIEVLHVLFEGVSSLHDRSEDLITDDLMERIRDIKERFFEERGLERTWNDPFDLLEVLEDELRDHPFFAGIEHERLGHMGVILRVINCPGAPLIHKKKIIGPLCSKAFFLGLILKSEFPDRIAKIRYSSYSPTGSSTELLFK